MAIPVYEGSMPYAFISYAHKDSELVMPILSQLSAKKCRLWYDAGIEIGEEWPETVAAHLAGAQTVVIFISHNSIASQNCNREVHFAVSKKKRLLVVYLEEVTLSLGMEMQLGVGQALLYHAENRASFSQSLLSAQGLRECFEGESETHPAPVASESVDACKARFLENNRVYGGRLHRYCENKPHVVIPEGILEICPGVFFNSPSLKSIYIPSTVKQIGSSAFFGCSALLRVEIADGVESIEEKAFAECVSLSEVVIPNSVREIGYCAFLGCTSLRYIKIPTGVARLDFSAFLSCTALKSISAPAHLEGTLRRSLLPPGCTVTYYEE